MAKLIAGLCFAAICMVYANRKSTLCKLKLGFISEILAFLRMCKEMIRYLRTEVGGILRIAANKYPNLKFIKDGNFTNCFGYECEIKDFMERIGSSDLNGQIDLCQRYLDFFENEYVANKEELQKQAKTYKALGLFGAAAIIVIFI